MDSLDRNGNAASHDEVILDGDFDEWQSSDPFGDFDRDSEFGEVNESEFDDFARDSHFLMHELDFSSEFESL